MKPRIPYDDAVEEALCFGWIDSTVKTIDKDRYAQRYTPRRPGSQLSETNAERMRRLIKAGRMTPVGLAAVRHAFDSKLVISKLVVSKDILSELKKDPATWRHFQKFPDSYKRIRIIWIDGARKRPAIFKQRLRYFLKMTAKNKRFGMVQ